MSEQENIHSWFTCFILIFALAFFFVHNSIYFGCVFGAGDILSIFKNDENRFFILNVLLDKHRCVIVFIGAAALPIMIFFPFLFLCVVTVCERNRFRS